MGNVLTTLKEGVKVKRPSHAADKNKCNTEKSVCLRVIVSEHKLGGGGYAINRANKAIL